MGAKPEALAGRTVAARRRNGTGLLGSIGPSIGRMGQAVQRVAIGPDRSRVAGRHLGGRC